MPNIEIKDEQLHTLVSAAILQMLSPEKREELVAQGIANLLKGNTNSYDKRSELERIFQQSLEHVTREIMRKLVAEDPVIMEKLTSVVTEGVNKVFADSHRDKLVERVASVISENLWKDR